MTDSWRLRLGLALFAGAVADPVRIAVAQQDTHTPLLPGGPA